MSGLEETLDPQDWEALRALSHRIIDEAIEYTRDVRDRPLWQAMPKEVREVLNSPLPQDPKPLDEVYDLLSKNVMAYPMGNTHPRFWMWYMGSSNFTGALGDFLAAVQGSNLGGGNHAASLVDQQVVDWCKQMLGFPETASGTLVSGGSMANIIGLTVARNQMADADVRTEGVGALDRPLRFYGSDQLHSCHQIAVESLGLGSKSLRKIRSHPDCTIDIESLKFAITEDRAAGFNPACVIATAGTVNTGAIDDLQAIKALCQRENMWFHVDGCIGALIAIAPGNKSRVSGIELADSIALDPHKWLHAPFEVGCALIRDRDAHYGAFTLTPEFLEMTERGIASAHWLHDFGLQTSRGFRALKVWMALQEHGVQKFGRLIDQNIAQAHYLSELICKTAGLELTMETSINIVCYRFDPGQTSEEDLKRINTEIMLQMQETGVAAISDTTVHGRHCLRAAINNHRTVATDLAFLVSETLRLGNAIVNASSLFSH
ncbi:pyridoxal phosphate-dependent decarboxylase family protein [Candidatus Halocynthiibacter alkanivorans]|uniref:pyridoxal phosphate-dependent decarboxylase family protein n=1 Tax=Candidatus Halocynthiibacter alkanivorans TaxID=2267619 RepID=UPI000DF375D9|nr:pyridoxal-dependent decarboxylase [Candidatus Halocynthiibacter alkanivorans]